MLYTNTSNLLLQYYFYYLIPINWGLNTYISLNFLKSLNLIRLYLTPLYSRKIWKNLFTISGHSNLVYKNIFLPYSLCYLWGITKYDTYFKQWRFWKTKLHKIGFLKFNTLYRYLMLNFNKQVFKFEFTPIESFFFYSKRTEKNLKLQYLKIFKPRVLGKMQFKSIANTWSTNDVGTFLHKIIRPSKNPHQRFNHFFKFHHSDMYIMREARLIHWKYTPKETLNRRTYKQFLTKEISLKNQRIIYKSVVSILGYLHLFLSWKHLILAINLETILINGQPATIYSKLSEGDILALPKYSHRLISYSFFQKKKKLRIRQQKKRFYKYIKSKNIIWKTRQKYLFNKVEYNRNNFFFVPYLFHFDSFTNTLGILKTLKHSKFPVTFSTRYHNLMKLNKWRFYL